MSYTTRIQKVTAEHLDSDTWHRGADEIRLHKFRCTVCGGTYYQGPEVYEHCPRCGFRIYHLRRAS